MFDPPPSRNVCGNRFTTLEYADFALEIIVFFILLQYSVSKWKMCMYFNENYVSKLNRELLFASRTKKVEKILEIRQNSSKI